jgi:hypothetical protein
MKKLLLLSLVALFIFTGCQKEEKEKEKDTLVGGYFSGFAYTGGGFYFLGVWIAPYDVYWSYRFIDERNAERTANEREPYGTLIGSPDPYTYTYKYPDLILIDEDGKERKGVFIEKNVFRMGDVNYKKQ